MPVKRWRHAGPFAVTRKRRWVGTWNLVPRTGYLDQFGRADGPISGGIWAGTPDLGVVSNQLSVKSGTAGEHGFTAANYGPDCEAYIRVNAFGGAAAYLWVREVAGFSGYALHWSSNGQVFLSRYDSATETVLKSTGLSAVGTGDVLLLRAIGSSLQVWLQKVATGFWSQILQAEDSTYNTAARLGVGVFSNTTLLDDFGGGTIGVTAVTYNKTGSVISQGLASGTDNEARARQNVVISQAVVSGPDQSNFVRKNVAIVDNSILSGPKVVVAGGITYNKTGLVISAAVASGVDQFTSSETGLVISAGVLAGPDQSNFVRKNVVISDGVLKGADQYTSSETGLVVSSGVLSGDQVVALGRKNVVISDGVLKGADQFTSTETGLVISAGVLSGIDASILARKNIVIVDNSILRGPDQYSSTETGLVISAAVLSGFDQYTATESGLLISASVLSGVRGNTQENDTNVVLLIHADGTDASTTFQDTSSYRHAITVGGDAQVDTAQSVFGGASALFDGVGDSLSSAYSSDWNLGSGDFSIDFRVRFNATTNQFLISQWNETTGNKGWQISLIGTALRFRYSVDGTASTVLDTAWGPSTGVWYHVAVVRTSNVLRVFVNGAQIGTDQTLSATIYPSTEALTIGLPIAGSVNTPFNGWMDEIRISKGRARWTSAFLVPTDAYVEVGGIFKTGAFVSALVLKGADQFLPSETGAVISAGVLSGDQSIALNRKNVVIVSSSILSGADQTTFSESGRGISDGVLKGADATTFVRKNIVIIDNSVLSGADATTFLRKNVAIIGNSILRGSAIKGVGLYTKTGLLVSVFVLSGADQSTFNRKNVAISASVLSGFKTRDLFKSGLVITPLSLLGDGKIITTETGIVISEAALKGDAGATRSKSGRVLSGFLASGMYGVGKLLKGHARSTMRAFGVDVITHSRKNRVISDFLMRGIAHSLFTETGKVISASVAKGSKLRLVQKLGKVLSVFVARGADSAIHAERGSLTGDWVARGVHQRISTRTGRAISAFSVIGKRMRLRFKTGTVKIDNSKITGVKLRLVPRKGKAIAICAAKGGRQHTAVRASIVKMELIASGTWQIDFNDDPELFEHSLLGVEIETPELLSAGSILTMQNSLLSVDVSPAELLEAQTPTGTLLDASDGSETLTEPPVLLDAKVGR